MVMCCGTVKRRSRKARNILSIGKRLRSSFVIGRHEDRDSSVCDGRSCRWARVLRSTGHRCCIVYMKLCSYCGAQYDDEALECVLDQTPLGQQLDPALLVVLFFHSMFPSAI